MPHGDDLIGMLAILMLFGIPIIAILTSHQRKMAELMHQRHHDAMPNPEIQGLREEIRELKTLVHQQAIAVDNLTRALPSDAQVRARVEV